MLTNIVNNSVFFFLTTVQNISRKDDKTLISLREVVMSSFENAAQSHKLHLNNLNIAYVFETGVLFTTYFSGFEKCSICVYLGLFELLIILIFAEVPSCCCEMSAFIVCLD